MHVQNNDSQFPADFHKINSEGLYGSPMRPGLTAGQSSLGSFNSSASSTVSLRSAHLDVSYEKKGVFGASIEMANSPGQQNKATFEVAVSQSQVENLALLLFDSIDDVVPVRSLPMQHVGGGIYSVSISGESVGPGLVYALAPGGSSVDHSKFQWLVDPDAKALTPMQWLKAKPTWENPEPCRNDFIAPKAVLMPPVDHTSRPPIPVIPHEERVIYEADVSMTTTIPDDLLPDELKGTQGTLACFRAPYVIEYLKRFNVTTIEVMPIQNAGDEWSIYSSGRENVWKYMPASFFAVHPGYCHAKTPIEQREELIKTVDAYHAAGIEFIIDFVGGHTFEGAKNRPADGRELFRIKGPTLSLRGLADRQYYHVDGHGNYVDATACEHTVNINNELGRGLMLRARDYWLDEIRIAGLRVDQASIFGRREHSLYFDPWHPFLREFTRADRLFIAEPCDAWGSFSGDFRHSGPWKEQIFRDRDITRAFFAAELNDPHYRGENIVGRLASSVAGYSDVFKEGENLSVRFADCHDGMNVWDHTAEMLQQLVRQKVLTIDTFLQPEKVIEARVALAKAVHASVMFSPGPYMISRGAEVLRTQGGMDNPFDRREYKGISWTPSGKGLDGERLDFRGFMETASSLRANLRVFNTTKHYNGNGGVRWFNREGTLVQGGTKGDDNGRAVAWESQQRFLAALYPGFPFKKGQESPSSVYVVRTGTPADFKLPKLDAYHVWVREVDTSLRDSTVREVIDSNSAYHVNYPSVCVFTLRLKSELN